MEKVRAILRSMMLALSNLYSRVARPFEGMDPSEELTKKQIRRRKWIARTGYAAVFALFLALLLHVREWRSSQLPFLRSGEVAERDIVVPLTVDLESLENSEGMREEMAKRVAPVFDYDETVLPTWIQSWEQAVRRIREEFYVSDRPMTPRTQQLLETLNARIQSYTGQTILARDLVYMHQQRFSPAIQQAFRELAQPLIGKLIASSDLFPSYYSTGVIVRQVDHSLTETLIYDVSRIWSLDHAREFLRQIAASLPKNDNETQVRVLGILSTTLVTNVKFNSELTQRRISFALGKQKVQVQSLRRGNVLVRRGERATDVQISALEGLRSQLRLRPRLARLAITFGLFWLLLIVVFRIELSRRAWWRMTFKDACVFAATVLLGILGARFSMTLFAAALRAIGIYSGAEYLMPVAAGGIVVHLILGKEAATNYAALVALSLSLWMDQSVSYGVWCFAVTSAAVHRIRSCKQRTDLYRAGAWSGFVGSMMAACFFLMHSQGMASFDWKQFATQAVFAFMSGILSAVIAGSVIPILESLFGYTTSLKLLELSNFNHPLLHDLMMKAPGTYHHSIIVGSLAEIASDRVKANALLARVSAYYHDIGKMNKPLYYIENQSPAQNPHDQLAPSMSAKILFSHVKLGVRMGKEHQLGKAINGIIEQHHGTTLVSFFFNKAKEKGPNESPNESDFRYPGPKPQTREAAIVMIADACEAATRSIADPTPMKIQTMVRNTINKRFLDQQFSDCELTMSDLAVIEECFTRTLVSLYHHRIEYPNQRQDLAASPQATEEPKPARPTDRTRHGLH